MLRFFLAGLLLAALVPWSADAGPLDPFDLSDPTPRPFRIGLDVGDLLTDDPNDPNTYPPLDGNIGTTGGPYLDFCLGDAACPTIAFPDPTNPTTWIFLHPAAATEALVNADENTDSVPGTFASPGFEAGSPLNPFPVNATAFFVDTLTGHMTVSIYGRVVSATLGQLGFQAQYKTDFGPWDLPMNPLDDGGIFPMPAVTIGDPGDEGGFSRGDFLGVVTLSFFCTRSGSVVPPLLGAPACDDPSEPLSYIADIHPFDPLTGEASAWAPIKITSLDDPNEVRIFLVANELGDVRFREIPEPTAVLLLSAGLVGLAFLRRRSA